MEKVNLKDMTLLEMQIFFANIGEQKFRAKQVFSWIYKGVKSFDEMTDLSKSLREKLFELSEIGNLEILKVQCSQKDDTKKYLFKLKDGNSIESVFMKYKYGNSICISSQAGCRMGCKFCASGILGLQRNLTCGEIIDQIVSVENNTGEKISNIVIMGTGEPFDNYENLEKFLRNVNDKEGLNIGMRNITVSTCGLVPTILQFAKDFPQVNLAISLHGSNDNVRSSSMPINKRYNIRALLDACRQYIDITGRRITFEYALVFGINDGVNHAKELATLLKGITCHVNLIPLNRVPECGFEGSSRKHAQQFKLLLEQYGINTTIRRELGSDISAACGQLRLTNN